MNSEAAMAHLAAYRGSTPADGRLQKALKCIENDSLLRAQLAAQVEFDRQMCEAIGALPPPEDLRRRLQAGQPLVPAGRQARQNVAAILTVCVGIAVIVGVLLFFHIQSSRGFPGSEALQRLAAGANRMSGDELDPISEKAGFLNDWFYMRGFEGYRLPKELELAPAVGSRLLKQDGHMVAQVAIDLHHSLVYVFRPEDFGVQLPESGEWKVFEADDWAAAAKYGDRACTMITFRGTEDEMRDFLQTLTKK